MPDDPRKPIDDLVKKVPIPPTTQDSGDHVPQPPPPPPPPPIRDGDGGTG